MRIRSPFAIATVAVLLSGCALFGSKAPPAAPVAAVQPPEPPQPRPALPAGFARSFTTPTRDIAGRYVTPNSGISAAERLWHVRSALNVAALACRESDMAPAYNAMLQRLKTPFAKADAEVKAIYRARHGKGWQDAHDDAMTRLYNWFSQPFAQAGLCAAAAGPLTEAQTLNPADTDAFATRALPALEAPVLAGFQRWDAYQVADADWRSRYETPVAMLKLAPVASR